MEKNVQRAKRAALRLRGNLEAQNLMKGRDFYHRDMTAILIPTIQLYDPSFF